jgi:hypothetical protein
MSESNLECGWCYVYLLWVCPKVKTENGWVQHVYLQEDDAERSMRILEERDGAEGRTELEYEIERTEMYFPYPSGNQQHQEK